MFMCKRIGLTAAALGLLLCSPVALRAADDDDDLPDGVEVLGRGPVHEAFAQTVSDNPQPGPVISRAPPAPIDELPPDERPQGEVEWIPGYWHWDDVRNDFVWVSGFWRQPPPGRVWVPGEWVRVDDGWQWSPGYWAPAGREEATYLPPPPDSLEAGPSTPAPDDDSVYVPGCWVWREERYVWRPGYWIDAEPDWVWVPSCYRWTPAGCVFVAGYWDYPLVRRGFLYGCLGFRPGFRFAGFRYTPRWCVSNAFLTTALFVRPNWYHYYYGDYFGANYAARGYRPWVSYRIGPSARDPLYAHYRVTHSTTRVRDLRALYAGRARGSLAVPPHTLAQQRAVLRGVSGTQARGLTVLRRPSEFRRPFVTVSAAERARQQARVAETRRVADVRRTTEVRLRSGGRAPLRGDGRPVRAELGAVRPFREAVRPGARTPPRPRPPAAMRRELPRGPGAIQSRPELRMPSRPSLTTPGGRTSRPQLRTGSSTPGGLPDRALRQVPSGRDFRSLRDRLGRPAAPSVTRPRPAPGPARPSLRTPPRAADLPPRPSSRPPRPLQQARPGPAQIRSPLSQPRPAQLRPSLSQPRPAQFRMPSPRPGAQLRPGFERSSAPPGRPAGGRFGPGPQRGGPQRR